MVFAAGLFPGQLRAPYEVHAALGLGEHTDPHLVYVSTYFYMDTIKAVPGPGSERYRLTTSTPTESHAHPTVRQI